jgi:hypothetical protein
MTTATGTRTDISIEATTLDRMAAGTLQVAMGAMVSIVGLIGVWGMASMIIGIARSGGILGAAQSWLTAIGM